MVDKRQDLDTVIYPALFCFVHFLELRLKNVLLQTFKLGQTSLKTVPRTHNLVHLWRDTCKALKETFPNTEYDSVSKLLDSEISELSKFGVASEQFRFPQDTKGSPTLSGLERVNVKNLQTAITDIIAWLDGLEIALDEAVSSQLEMEAEYSD
jgi:hypothetical protein